MKISNPNKIRMLKAVQYTLMTNSDITSSFALEVGRYDEYLQKIRELSQKISNVENLPNSEDYETAIRQASLKIASAVLAYAAMTGRSDLMTNEHIKPKAIEKAAGSQLYNNCIQILETVKENQLILDLFGITDTKVKDFENMVFYFGRLNEQGQSNVTGEVNGVCEEAEKFLEETIDHLVEHSKLNYPKFYNEYKFARNSIEEPSQSSLYFFA